MFIFSAEVIWIDSKLEAESHGNSSRFSLMSLLQVMVMEIIHETVFCAIAATNPLEANRKSTLVILTLKLIGMRMAEALKINKMVIYTCLGIFSPLKEIWSV